MNLARFFPFHLLKKAIVEAVAFGITGMKNYFRANNKKLGNAKYGAIMK